jgi:universal stress protein E
MDFFKNILVFYNEEFAGIKEEVTRLVHENQAKLKIIDVLDKFDQYTEVLPPSSSISDLKDLIISERRLEILGHFEADPDIRKKMTVVFKFGNVVVEIIREAIGGQHDLVVKAASGNKTFKDRLFGNIAVKLLRECPCPVLIFKPSERKSFQKILVAVDPEKVSEENAEIGNNSNPLYRDLLDISIVMARINKSHLSIFHSWFLPGETLFSSGRTRIEPEKLNQMKILAEKIQTQKINAIVADYDLSDIRHSIEVRNGDPSQMIVDYVDKNNIDLIVMGTIGRSGMSGLIIGNTAEKVIDRVNCSVLAIKPTNFKSRITTG